MIDFVYHSLGTFANDIADAMIQLLNGELTPAQFATASEEICNQLLYPIYRPDATVERERVGHLLQPNDHFLTRTKELRNRIYDATFNYEQPQLTSLKEYENEVIAAVRAYLPTFIDIVNPTYMGISSPRTSSEQAFWHEYNSYVQRIRHDATIDNIQELAQGVQHWQNAIADAILEDAMLLLKFICLYTMAQAHYRIPFPAPLTHIINKLDQ